MFKGTSVFRASWGGILSVATIIIGCGSGIVATDVSTTSPDTGTPLSKSPIQHVIVIMQENRTFDNLFNGYPGADTVQTGLDKEKGHRQLK